VATIVLCLALVVLLVHLATNSAEFSRYNIGWNGTSRFFDSLDRHRVTEIEDPGQLAAYTNTTLFVIAPYRPFSARDSAAYRAYVDRGNTLILADDFGTGSELLAGMGSSMTILPGNLSSVDRAYDNPYTVVAFPAGTALPSLSGTGIVLDKAAAVSGGDPVLATGLISWIDTAGTPGPGAGITISRYAVAANETLGGGELYVIGDPSIFINAMQETAPGYANAQFISQLSDTHKTILVDAYSTRSDQLTGIWAVARGIQTNPAYRAGTAALILLVVIIAWQKKII